MGTVGLIPAAGRGSRLAPSPCSKEVLPLGTRTLADGSRRPKALIQYLLEAYHESGIGKAVVVTGGSKWDIPAFVTASGSYGVSVSYLGLSASPGTPFSLDHAYPWIREDVCALGFPDILLPVRAPFLPLLEAYGDTGADVVLGLFAADDPTAVDVVEIASDGRLVSLIAKPETAPGSCRTWSVAVWGPRFSGFMHDALAAAWHSVEARAALLAKSRHSEIFVGDVFNLAASEGLDIRGVELSDQPSLDVGSVDSFSRAVQLKGAGAWGAGSQDEVVQ